MSPLDREAFPTASQAQEAQAARSRGERSASEQLAWEEALAKAAIERDRAPSGLKRMRESGSSGKIGAGTSWRPLTQEARATRASRKRRYETTNSGRSASTGFWQERAAIPAKRGGRPTTRDFGWRPHPEPIGKAGRTISEMFKQAARWVSVRSRRLLSVAFRGGARDVTQRPTPAVASAPSPTRVVMNEPEWKSPSRPMSRYELYCWHRANGTLGLFFAMFRL